MNAKTATSALSPWKLTRREEKVAARWCDVRQIHGELEWLRWQREGLFVFAVMLGMTLPIGLFIAIASMVLEWLGHTPFVPSDDQQSIVGITFWIPVGLAFAWYSVERRTTALKLIGQFRQLQQSQNDSFHDET